MEKNFLAFDCGATSGRAVLATIKDDKMTMEEVYRFPNATMQIGGRFYWNVYSIYQHMLQCLSELGNKGVKIASIGIDTWGVDFGFVGKDGELLSLPRAYRDPYTDTIPEMVYKSVPREELYMQTGIQIMNFNSIFQMYAQKQEGSEAMKHSRSMMFMPDLLSYLLTGKEYCEYTVASTSGMIDQKEGCFKKGLLERLGIPTEMLLEVCQPGKVIGVLRSEIAEKTGLGEVPVVAVAGHDTASAVVAVPAQNERFAYLSSGTWSLMGIETPQPIIDRRSQERNFTNEGGIEGTTRFLKNITGMWLLEQSRLVWEAAGRHYTYPEMVKMAEACSGYTGRINPDDSRFANPKNMDSEIRAALKEGGYKEPTSDGEMLSCIYHSLAERYNEVLGWLKEFMPESIERLHVIGGGSANALLNQWTANTTGVEVMAGPVEATAIGNVLLQAKANGMVADRWQMRKIVGNSFETKVFKPTK